MEIKVMMDEAISKYRVATINNFVYCASARETMPVARSSVVVMKNSLAQRHGELSSLRREIDDLKKDNPAIIDILNLIDCQLTKYMYELSSKIQRHQNTIEISRTDTNGHGCCIY